ncbi:beta-glucanase (GH16 family) [Flavobacterium sp. 7E]|uniref:RICIN domain-containing protein n=1 Tax=Flavobacterium sp. 7E TaxID=2735898 RepID=UPI00156F50C8|nr:RICIN domain-containing protein [Flavobacterium sp. 7E]NRS89363.1 beta-glucanase (GH16 family) [Flavobacterium sp. 7E]
MKKEYKTTFILLFFMTMGYSQNWQLVWQDEFNNNTISSDWVFETGFGVNNEQQFYRKENATVSNGKLIITAKKESFDGGNYTSARMTTKGKKSWKYGKIEASIAMPSFQGIWPAFWMLGDNIDSVQWPMCGEIDIMEHVNTGGDIYGTIHWDDNGHVQYGGPTNTNVTAFHTYGIEWDENTIKWFLDGVKYHEVSIAGNVNSTDEFHNNFFILFNLAVGGDWPGKNIDNNGFPAEMQVDYVRVYQKVNTPSIPATIDVVTAYKDCNYGGFSGGLTIGDYNLARLKSLGLQKDAISSLRVAKGFQAILFQDDNFSGTSTTITADKSCFDITWNNKVSSIRILVNGATNLGNTTYFLQNRNSGLNMEVTSLSTANNANIAQGNPTASDNQKFIFTHLGDGLYKIIAKNSGLSLDAKEFAKTNGSNIEQYTYAGSANQQFILVPTGDGYYKIIAKHSGKLVEVAAFSTANNANIQQWENVDQLSGQWKLIPATTAVSTLIQAENYTSMNGIKTETTTDTGGGLNVAYTDTDDWMAYKNINFPTSDSYLIEYRVASAVNGAKISSDLNAGSIVLGSLDVPNTGGWQNWTTISHTVNVNAGTYNFGLFIKNSGVNINWIKISKTDSTAKISADFTSKNQTLEADKILTIYPNPVENMLLFSKDIAGTNCNIVDSQGSLILQQKISSNSLDVSMLKAGIYFIVIEKEGIKTVKRFIKK